MRQSPNDAATALPTEAPKAKEVVFGGLRYFFNKQPVGLIGISCSNQLSKEHMLMRGLVRVCVDSWPPIANEGVFGARD